MKLYELSGEFNELFDRFDEINDMEFNTNADGDPIDADGNVIENPDGYKAAMLDAWFDTLDGIEGEFDAKAENIAVYIKVLKAEAEALEREEKALKSRKEQKQNKFNSLKSYLESSMKAINKLKIDMPRAKLSIRNNAESVVIDDEQAFRVWAERFGHDDLLKYSEPEIRKADTKKFIQNGGEVPNAHLERSQSLIIK